MTLSDFAKTSMKRVRFKSDKNISFDTQKKKKKSREQLAKTSLYSV
jgi:hypothetical protein